MLRSEEQMLTGGLGSRPGSRTWAVTWVMHGAARGAVHGQFPHYGSHTISISVNTEKKDKLRLCVIMKTVVISQTSHPHPRVCEHHSENRCPRETQID